MSWSPRKRATPCFACAWVMAFHYTTRLPRAGNLPVTRGPTHRRARGAPLLSRLTALRPRGATRARVRPEAGSRRGRLRSPSFPPIWYRPTALQPAEAPVCQRPRGSRHSGVRSGLHSRPMPAAWLHIHQHAWAVTPLPWPDALLGRAMSVPPGAVHEMALGCGDTARQLRGKHATREVMAAESGRRRSPCARCAHPGRDARSRLSDAAPCFTMH